MTAPNPTTDEKSISIKVSDVTDLIEATKAATKAHNVMCQALEGVPTDQISSSDDGAFAASSFLAGPALEFGIQQGISDANLPVVIEAALKQKVGKELAEWYASNLNALLADDSSRLGINTGRAAALLTEEDKVTPATLLAALLHKATRSSPVAS